MKINYKKSLKFVTLLMSALLIAAVSATMYNYMYMNATPIGVKGGYDVSFYAGADFVNASGSITNYRQTVTFTGMQGSNGSLATYSNPVTICNNGTVAHNVALNFSSWTFNGSASTTLDYVNISEWDSSNNLIGCMSLIAAGGGNQTAGTYSLAASAYWRAQWDIMWYGNATAGTDSVNLYVKIIVQS